jgi:hypothetical protein
MAVSPTPPLHLGLAGAGKNTPWVFFPLFFRG